jgi:hypothetical protein
MMTKRGLPAASYLVRLTRLYLIFGIGAGLFAIAVVLITKEPRLAISFIFGIVFGVIARGFAQAPKFTVNDVRSIIPSLTKHATQAHRAR